MDGMDQVSWLLAAARFLHWGACLVLFGVMVFINLVYLPVLKGMKLETGPALGKLHVLTWVLFLMVIITGLIWFWVIAADMGGNTLLETLNPGVAGVVWEQTQVGEICHWRSGIAVVLGVYLIVLPQSKPTSSNRFQHFNRFTTTFLAGALLASLAWTGHGPMGTGWGRELHLSADVLHIVIAAIWPGGLIPLAIFLRSLGRSEADLALAKNVVARFSVSSVTCVIGLAFTGLVNSLFLVGSIKALFFTFYGQLLVIKVTLFAILICCGAINLFYLSPRLTSQAGTVRRLSQVVLREIGVAAVVLALVAIIGLSEPSEFRLVTTVASQP